MKNIFAYDVTENPENEVFDGARYVIRRLDGGQEQILYAAAKSLEAELEAAKLPKPLRILKTVFGWVAALYLCVLVELLNDVPLRRLVFHAPVCSLILAVSFFLWLSLWLTARRRAKRNPQREAYRQASAVYAQELTDTRGQLGVPENARKMDIITYRYQLKSGKERICSSPFINIESAVFLEDDCLCVSDAICKVALPLEKMTGIRTVKKRLCVASWNKDTPYNKGIYKRFRITVNSFGMVFFKPYYVLTLRDFGQDFELYIAPYDLDTVRQVLSGGFGGTFSLPLQ